MIKPTKRRIAKTASLPAPTGGINAHDPIANMKESEAVTMENWFPNPSSVDLRNGHTIHVSGFANKVDTLAFYNNGVTQELYAISNGAIYDVTTAGAVGASVVAGLSNSRFQSINMGTAGGSFLLMVNGADKMRIYNGTAWDYDGGGIYTVTGVNTANCIHINNFKNRVWLIENDSLRAWYLPVSSIAGAAASLDLSGLFKLGGYLMAMANWTIDNAAGVDDYAAFITSEGEVALYKGTDPSSSNTWAMVGTFRMGKPIGRRCFCKAGADVLVLTEDGAFPLSKALLTDRSQLSLAATNKISSLINSSIISYSGNYGWQPIIYPLGKKLIINVPTVEGVTSKQYVMNTEHGAWTVFTGWNANCWELMGDGLYFGGIDGVYQADTGSNDNGNNIDASVQQAFSYFNNKGATKKWTMARCVFSSDGSITPAVRLNTDFFLGITAVAPSYSSTGSEWNVATWDVDSWVANDMILKRWQTVTGVGFAGGLFVKITAKNITCKWQSSDFVYEVGSVL